MASMADLVAEVFPETSRRQYAVPFHGNMPAQGHRNAQCSPRDGVGGVSIVLSSPADSILVRCASPHRGAAPQPPPPTRQPSQYGTLSHMTA